MKQDYALKGDIVHAQKMGELTVIENGFLVVRGGRITGIAHEYAGNDIVDYTGSLIIPGLCDLHVHASQYAMRGMGLDMELLPWLNAYTFPEESRFSDIGYAREVYTAFVEALKRAGTTRACVFATIHTDATLLLMDLLEEARITAYVGKVNMDRNAPPALCEETAQSIEETERWLAQCDGRHRYVRPILTPRFIPSCSGPLLQKLGNMARTRSLPVQSHLSENKNEVEWVRQLMPDAADYGHAYERYGLFGGGTKTAMAHCVHITEEERHLMSDKGVWAIHCPDSNANLASGIANVRAMLDLDVPVALGSDVAGGSLLSVLDVAAQAVKCSKLRAAEHGGQPLTIPEAFYLATGAGAEFFGDAPGFATDSPLHAVVLSSRYLVTAEKPAALEQLQRMVYLCDDRITEAVYANGSRIYPCGE